MESLEQLSFEQALAALEESVARLEAGDLSLDEMLTVYERGARLTQHCQQLLDGAELRLQQLIAGAEGEAPTVAPFTTEEVTP